MPTTEPFQDYEMVFIEEKAIAVPYRIMHQDAHLPRRQHCGDAAFDLAACFRSVLNPGATHAVHTGIAVAIPEGHAGLVLSRSGLAKDGIVVANAPGLIDSGYRGELIVLLRNEGHSPYFIHPGDRIAQLVVSKLPLVYMKPVDDLPPARDERGDDGFGSTGLAA